MYQFDQGAWVDIHYQEEGLFGMVIEEVRPYLYKVLTPLDTREVDGRAMVLSKTLNPEDKLALLSMMFARFLKKSGVYL